MENKCNTEDKVAVILFIIFVIFVYRHIDRINLFVDKMVTNEEFRRNFNEQ
jgi:hypothetical protein